MNPSPPRSAAAGLRAPRARRTARALSVVLAATALSGCAGMTFQFANTAGYSSGGRVGVGRPPIDVYDPASPVNVWNVF